MIDSIDMAPIHEDQQVPENKFQVVNEDCGVIPIQRDIPDIDALLSDLQGFAETEYQKQTSSRFVRHRTTSENATFEVPELLGINDSLADLNMEVDGNTDLSLYDDYNMQLKRIKTEVSFDDCHPYTTSRIEGTTCSKTSGQLPPVEDFLGGHIQQAGQCSIHYDEGLYDATVQKIEFACMAIGVHNDPYSWTMEEVRRWALWAVDQFSGLQHNYLDLSAFEIDGTTLSLLTKEEFIKRSPAVGEYLFAELEIWKNTYTLQTMPVNSSVQSSPDTEISYIDLDELNQSTNSLTSVTYCNYTPDANVTSYPSTASNPLIGNHGMSTISDREHGIKQHPIVGCCSVSPAPSLDSTGSSATSWSCSKRTDMTLKRDPKEELQFRGSTHQGKQATHLWQFLKELLLQPHSFQNCIRWLNRAEGIFKIEDSARVAKLWGQRKNRPAMNYDKLSRSIRQYYKKGIIKKTTNSKRLVYQFCPQYM